MDNFVEKFELKAGHLCLTSPKQEGIKISNHEEAIEANRMRATDYVRRSRMRSKQILDDLNEELSQLKETFARLQTRSKDLGLEIDSCFFTPEPYPPEIQYRIHTKRHKREKATSVEQRLEREKESDRKAQYRKSLRDKYDKMNLLNEIEFLDKANKKMHDTIHNYLPKSC